MTPEKPSKKTPKLVIILIVCFSIILIFGILIPIIIIFTSNDETKKGT